MIFRKGSRKYSYQGAGPGDDIPVMPCANLDTENSRMVLDLFRAVNRELKQTIVMVSHEPSHMEYFDRIIFIRDGVLRSGCGVR